MKIVIEGKELTKQELDEWRTEHAKTVAKAIKKKLPECNNADVMCEQLASIKRKMSYKEMTAPIKFQLALSTFATKMVIKKSQGKKRKTSVCTIFADGIKVDKLGKIIDILMMKDTPEYRKVNVSVCPDHYALLARGNTLEIIERSGNNPVPSRFFITFNDETGLETPRDQDYPYQSVGIAKLKDGTIMGGVRHQFKDTEHGIEAKMCVEFPAGCPDEVVRDHQKHLATEWSGWIQWAIEHQNEF